MQKVLEETIERFQTKPVDAGQLAKVKRHEKYGFLMQLDSPLHTAEAVVPFISAAGSLDAVDRLYKASEQVTPEDIQRAARKYFTPQRRTVIVLKGAQVSWKRVAPHRCMELRGRMYVTSPTSAIASNSP